MGAWGKRGLREDLSSATFACDFRGLDGHLALRIHSVVVSAPATLSSFKNFFPHLKNWGIIYM